METVQSMTRVWSRPTTVGLNEGFAPPLSNVAEFMPHKGELDSSFFRNEDESSPCFGGTKENVGQELTT